MGSEKDTFIGAYVEVTLNQIERTKILKQCENYDCKEYSKFTESNFCPNCGEKVLSRNKKETVCESIYDVFDKLEIDEDNFHVLDSKQENKVYLKSNTGDVDSFNIETNLAKELTNESIGGIIISFTSNHDNELNKIRDYYKQSVFVKFGVIEFYW